MARHNLEDVPFIDRLCATDCAGHTGIIVVGLVALGVAYAILYSVASLFIAY